MKLGIQPLCNSALADIRGKVTSDNVVEEIFSYITARYAPVFPNGEVNRWKLICSFSQKEVMEVQCDLLISTFKNQKTIALVKENIRRIPDRSLSHCAGALNLVLRKGFELKKRKRRPPPSAKLRCSNYYCSRYRDSIPYSSVGTCVYCPSCDDDLRCAECGYLWTGGCSACQSCEKGFV